MDSLALPIPILADDVELVAGVVSFFVVDALLHALLPFGYDHDDVHSFYEHAKQCESTNAKMAAYPRLAKK